MTLKQKLILQFAIGLVFFGLALFLTAGTVKFWEAWLFLGIWFIPGLFFSIYFYAHDPALVERRMRRREVVKEQKWIMAATYFIFIVAYLIPGLDFRFGWTRAWIGAVPLWLTIVSLVAVLSGYLITIWAMAVNRYASSIVVVEPEQKVISVGPYKWVRHPMYFGALILMLFTPTALGSYVAVPFFALVIPVLVLRLLNEEKVLREQLAGYSAYCEATRQRLIPRVW